MVRHNLLIGSCLALLALAPASGAGASDDSVTLEPETELVALGPAVVTVREFEARLSRIEKDQRAAVANDPERLAQMLKDLARQELLGIQAKEKGLLEREDVKASVRLAKQEALARALMEEVKAQAEPADYEQQAREYYLTHPDEFQLPERVTVSHVLISTKEHPEEEARQTASEVLEMARDQGKDFKSLVKEYSDDPSASRNQGTFEDVQRGQMVEPFEEAAFGLDQPGQIAGPVKTEYGYHVIRLEERKPPEKQPFEAVKDSVVRKMEERHLQRAVQQYVGELQSEHQLEAEEPVIRALRERYRRQVERSETED